MQHGRAKKSEDPILQGDACIKHVVDEQELQMAQVRNCHMLISVLIIMLHGAQLLSYSCNVMPQSSAVFKKQPSTFAQTLP